MGKGQCVKQRGRRNKKEQTKEGKTPWARGVQYLRKGHNLGYNQGRYIMQRVAERGRAQRQKKTHVEQWRK